MKQKKLCVTIVSLLVWSFSFTQQLTNYTTKDGLPSNHVYRVIQDANGFIWIATDKGLVKYNGTTFKTFTTEDGLATNDIWDFNATPDGKLWFHSKATQVGYIENDSVYNFESAKKGEVFSSTFTSQINNEIILVGSNRYQKLKNSKWINYKNIELDTKSFYEFIEHRDLAKLYFKNTFKLDTAYVLDKHNQTVKKLHFGNYLRSYHKRGQITDSLYYWTNGKGYKILNLNTLQFSENTFKIQVNIEDVDYSVIKIINKQLQISGKGFVGILDKNFNVINTYYFPKNSDAHLGLIDKSNNIWLNSFTKGLYKLPHVKKDVKYLLNNQKVSHLSHIRDKIIASVHNKGFYVFDDEEKSFKPFIKDERYVYQPNYIEALDKSYFSSELYMYVYDNKSIKRINPKMYYRNNLTNHDPYRDAVYFNNLLYGYCSFGLHTTKPNSELITGEIPQFGINNLLPFNNKLLIATTSGLKQLNGDKIEKVNFKNQDLDTSVLDILRLSSSQILINTDGFGAYVSNLKTLKPLKGSEFLIVNSAFVEKDEVWLATNKGILFYKKEKNRYFLKRTINKNNGLPTADINDVLITGNDIMVSTNFGVAILSKNNIEDSQLLDVYIQDATYNDNQISETQSEFIYKKNNTLDFKVSTIDYSENNTAFSYEYRLIPIQKKWAKTNSKLITFSDLSPNDYTLNIKSAAKKTSINFKVKPLWWQQKTTKIVAVFFAIGLIAMLSTLLYRQTQRKKNVKLLAEKKLSDLRLQALRSQMNPHFVFNSLSAIQYYINANETEKSDAYLVQFSKLIRHFFELSKETEITLEQEIKLITNYLDLEKLRFKEKFSYSINIDSNLNINKTKLPTMLLQPIIENAVNHGIFNKTDSGNLQINMLKLDKNSLKIEIKDDGVGFFNTMKKTSKNVKSSHVLKDRLQYLNESKHWQILYSEKELYPLREDKGNTSTFIITKLI